MQPAILDLAGTEGAFREEAGFPRPQWAIIDPHIREHLPQQQWHSAFCDAVRQWMAFLAAALGGDYRVLESDWFFLLSYRNRQEAETHLAWAEECRTSIYERLEGIAWKEIYGKHVMIDLEDPDDYADYLAVFYPPGWEPPLASGLCVNRGGYVHMVLNTGTQRWTQSVICHELTHNLTAHLPLPLWLAEGLACVMQHDIAERPTYEVHFSGRGLWMHPSSIQAFWDGRAFDRDDVGESHMWYALAERLVRHLNDRCPDRFDEFVRKAHWKDCGQQAAMEELKVRLGECLGWILGPGDWHPKPLPKSPDPASGGPATAGLAEDNWLQG
jgi:hypothetical protein